MKKHNFLDKLKRKGRLEMVEPSEEICNSYLDKADNSLKSAKILLQNNLFEDSISKSYYAMYNCLTALLFRIGIKCENHTGSIFIFKILFGRLDLSKMISHAKKERIDKQYYVTSKNNSSSIDKSAKNMFEDAEQFLVQMKLMLGKLGNEEITKLRNKFSPMVQ